MRRTKVDGFETAALAILVFMWLFVLAFWATVGYIAYHFISKWW